MLMWSFGALVKKSMGSVYTISRAAVSHIALGLLKARLNVVWGWWRAVVTRYLEVQGSYHRAITAVINHLSSSSRVGHVILGLEALIKITLNLQVGFQRYNMRHSLSHLRFVKSKSRNRQGTILPAAC